MIIGILAAVAIPKFSSTKQRASRAAGIADMRNLATAQESFFADSSRYAAIADTGTGTGRMNFTPSTSNTRGAARRAVACRPAFCSRLRRNLTSHAAKTAMRNAESVVRCKDPTPVPLPRGIA